MAWSAKLISGDGGVSGYNEFEMVYNAGSQTDFKLKYGVNLGSDAPEVLYHTPDDGPPVPVAANDRNKLIFLTYHVPPQTETTDAIDINTPIARLIDGPDSQAVRAAMNDDVDKVKVAITPDGASAVTTYYTVLHGFQDTSTAYTSAAGALNDMAYNVVLALTCEPMGYGDSFTLNNALASSPHFLEFNTSATIADGWTATGSGPATPTKNNINYIIGNSSQRVTCASANDRIISDSVSVADGEDIVIYAWILKHSGTSVKLILRNASDSTDLASATLTTGDGGSVSDKTCLDSTGATWYRVPVSGTNSTGATKNYQVWVLGTAGNEVYSVDGCYLQTGTTTPPAGFMSANAWENLYTPENSESEINYIDTWGIPGDAPAMVELEAAFDEETEGIGTSGEVDLLRGWRWSDGTVLAVDVPYWEESDEMTDYDTAFTSGTGTTDNNYLRLPSGTASGTLYGTFNWSAYKKHAAGVFLIGRASSTSVTFQAYLSTGPYGGAANKVTVWTSETVTVKAANTWEIIPLGVIPQGNFIVSDTVVQYLHIVVANATSQTGDVDALICLPLGGSHEYVVSDTTVYSPALVSPAPDHLVIADPSEKAIFAGFGKNYRQDFMGSLWYAEPYVMTRTVLLFSHSDNEYDLTTAGTIELTITPRTRHLLGTV
jgi:hypothetical protein